MRIFVLTGVYWPDTVSVAQHLGDLCEALQKDGHQVTVLTSRWAYDEPDVSYQLRETHHGVEIQRIRSSKFDKSSTYQRVVNFMSFNLLTFWHLLWLPSRKYDIMIGLTVPPLVSFFGVFFSRIKRIPFVYWAMDMQPELAIASGMMRKGSFAAGIMTFMGNYIMRNSAGVIALDRFMADYIQERTHTKTQVSTVPVWPVMAEIYEGKRLDNPFRQQHGFGDKIVIMYSGNHSYVHPLDTWLEAARMLNNDDRFLFVSIGGGVRIKDVEQKRDEYGLKNIVRLPFQPREVIHLSLGAADLQVVVLGENQVAYTHPNKIYGAMFIGKPILYIGPTPSHVTDIVSSCPGNLAVEHGQADALVSQLLAFAALSDTEQAQIGRRNRDFAHANYHPDVLIKKMVETVLEGGRIS
jgi:colanic acid biosynthesis glycosyl transferase WcaI